MITVVTAGLCWWSLRCLAAMGSGLSRLISACGSSTTRLRRDWSPITEHNRNTAAQGPWDRRLAPVAQCLDRSAFHLLPHLLAAAAMSQASNSKFTSTGTACCLDGAGECDSEAGTIRQHESTRSPGRMPSFANAAATAVVGASLRWCRDGRERWARVPRELLGH